MADGGAGMLAAFGAVCDGCVALPSRPATFAECIAGAGALLAY